MRGTGAALIVALLGSATQEPVPAVAVVVQTRIDGATHSAICNFEMGVLAGAGQPVAHYVALKDRRLLTQVLQSADGPTPADRPGLAWIADLTTNRTTRVYFQKQEYTDRSFDQLRREAAQHHGNLRQLSPSSDLFFGPAVDGELPEQSQRRGSRFVFESSTRETGQTRAVAGVSARGIDLVVAAHDPGKTLTVGGGWIATGTVWLGPRLPAVSALQAAQRTYAKAISKGVYDSVFTETELPGAEAFDGCMPEHVYVAARVMAEMDKLDGTIVGASVVYQMEWPTKDFERAASSYELLEKRLTAFDRPLGGAPTKRTTVLTMAWEYVEISDRVDEPAFVIPPGFKKK